MAISSLQDEHKLLHALEHDDEAAFIQFYQHYWKDLLSIAWNHTKDKTLAEDIVHEVFMKLWENRNKQVIQSVGGFLSTAVKFSVFKHYRKEERRKNLVMENQLFNDPYVDDEAKINQLFLEEYINGIVEEMPERSRLVFKLSRTDGLKNPEIAAMLGISEKGVEANLTRALKMLRERMKNDGVFILLAVESAHFLLK